MVETKIPPAGGSNLNDYKSFASELIKKQMLIIGPRIALDKAQVIPGLTVDSQGTVSALSGDSYLVVKNLIDEYSALSLPVTHSVLCRLIEKYPTLKEDFSKAISKIELSCPIQL